MTERMHAITINEGGVTAIGTIPVVVVSARRGCVTLLAASEFGETADDLRAEARRRKAIIAEREARLTEGD